MITLSPPRIAFLKRLARGPVPLAEWRQYDQRFVRPMFLRQLFRLERNLDAVITQAGWDLHSEIIHGWVIKRQNPNRPTFVEASDAKTFPHMRNAKVN